MWSSDVTRFLRPAAALGMMMFLASCTVEPLNATSSNRLASDGTSESVREAMKSIKVDAVDTRVAQQVRNNLLFQLNGGSLEPGGKYKVNLSVSSSTSSLAVDGDSLSTTSAQVTVTVEYKLINIENNKIISSGKRLAVASFDQTPQKFANERAERDAQNRAAKDVAVRLRLAIGQALTQFDS